MNEPAKSTWKELGVALLVLAVVCALLMALVPTFGRIAERSNITKGINNCRQVITALRLYASDHDGKYPDALLRDPQSANEVFRELFKEGILDNEMIFGCPLSPFNPDGNIDPTSPDKVEAVKAGENHWAMTAGLKDSSAGSIPLVYENPAVASWPPKWDASAKEKPVRGRRWLNGIIVGMNDSSVDVQPLAAKKGTVTLKEVADGKDLFELANDKTKSPPWRILDVEVAPK